MIRKWKLARIGLWSAMKTGFVLFAAGGFLMGLFGGVMSAFFVSLMATAASMRDPGFGPASVVFMPIFGALFTGLFGAVATFFGALVYNVFASVWDGLEVELDTGKELEPADQSGSRSAPTGIGKRTRRIWRQPPASGRRKYGLW